METSNIIVQDKHEQSIQRLRTKITPVFIIVLFSAAVTVVRITLLPEFNLFIHFLLFLGQVFLMTCIWYLVNWLNEVLDKPFPFDRAPLKRIAIQISLTVVIVAPVIIVLGSIVIPYVPGFVTHQFVAVGIVLFMVIIFLFNFGFYAFHFFRNWQQSVVEKSELQVKAAELEKEKFNLQYHQLKNQVNPHYLFNSLTSLDGLIQTNPALASEFVRHMSKVYRYTLQHKENEVVSLQEEMDFIGHYKELLRIRYNTGLMIEDLLSEDAKEKGIVMVTLQLLIDNAVKHNIVSTNEPLRIIIGDEGNYLVVKNNIQLR
ncbi:MAG TPA: histidine kinase, partial [Flavisolibacter sp.]|nr:histidine kinase [Flavisolibacter sp.]